MKVFMSSEEHEAMKKRRKESVKLKGQQKYDAECEEKLENLFKKTVKVKNSKSQNKKNDGFKNNYKNFEYDYEEDFYDPDFNRY